MINNELQQTQEASSEALRAEISAKERALAAQQAENQLLAARLASAEAELSQLKGGLTFRMLDRYHRTVDRLFPLSSGRRHTYDALVHNMHNLLVKGQGSPGNQSRSAAESAKPIQDYVIVYQMGKVGSTSIVDSLRAAYAERALPVQVQHVHNFNGLDEIEADLRTRPNPEAPLRVITRVRALRKLIDEGPERKWKLISPVRDPIARSVAWYFHSLDLFIPDWRERWKASSLTPEALQESFFQARQASYGLPDAWFDEEMLPTFGIDVFAEPFPKAEGYKIYDGSRRASLLIMRLENLNACAPAAMKEFLGLEHFLLIKSNVGDDKEYAEVYRAFKRTPLPKSYVEEVYNTRYMKHFYTEQEIERFAQQWTAPKNG